MTRMTPAEREAVFGGSPVERLAVLAHAPRLVALERMAGKRNLAPIVTWHDLELRVRELELFTDALRRRRTGSALTP